MKMAAMELGNTPRPTTWSPPLASISPPVLILATSSSNSLPHLVAVVGFLVIGVGRMICSMSNHIGAPRGLYLCPRGAFGRAPPCLARDPPWKKANLVSIKLARFS
jgi:hypothetical protein